MAQTTIPESAMTTLLDALDLGNRRVMETYPGERAPRQPIHTVYGGAHLFNADIVRKLGALALRTLEEHAPTPEVFGDALTLEPSLARLIYPRVVDKLTREPIEDLRIDFEDGFGNRSDDEEDRFAISAASELADAYAGGTLPPGVGIRIKPLGEELKRRSLRTFDLFLTTLLKATDGRLPPNFVVTLPKITAHEQVAALASACDAFEYWRDVPRGTLHFELMVETTQSIVAADGSIVLPKLVAEGRGRIVAVHFGPYDYTAACNITSAYQDIAHPACDFARHVMQSALAGTAIRLADGPTNIMPVGPHRPRADRPLTEDEREENRRVVHRAWKMHAGHVRRSLVAGFYQGWDLHPAQLPSRYAAVYAFFLEGLDAASDRLRHFVDRAAQATRVGDVFDDAATGQGLLNYFLRALNCGAIGEEEAAERSGLTLEELRSRSFLKILKKRRSES
jgi:citrate lyase beta subunit